MAVEPVAAAAASTAPEDSVKTLTLIVNPIATTVTTRGTQEIRDALGARFAVDVQMTEGKGHATELARDAVAAGADVVAVYAGDGTANEAIQSLAGTPTALAHLPGGNSSVLARMLGMGGDGLKAAQRLSASELATRAIDLGMVDGRAFAFTAGIGLDAAVVKMVDSDVERKERFRWGAFWMEAVRTARQDYMKADAMITIESGGHSLRGVTAIIQNAEAYTYVGPQPLTLSREVTMASGTLAATALLSGLRMRDVPSITFRTMAPVLAAGHPRIETLPAATEVVIRCDRPMPIQIDGDYWRELTEARFTVHAGGLQVVT